MRVLKGVLVVMVIALIAGAGFYLCRDAKETEQIEEAVMI